MAEIVQWLRDSFAVLNEYVGTEGEIWIDTDNWDLLLFDGTTEGGHRLLNRDNADARYQQINDELSGIGPYGADDRGFLTRLGPEDYTLRQITVTNELVVTDPDGFGGDPLLGLAETVPGDREFDGNMIITGVLQVNGGINANISGTVTGTFDGGKVVSSADGDFITIIPDGFGVRVRAPEETGPAWLQFTSNDGMTQWGLIAVEAGALAIDGATVTCADGFVGNLTGDVTGNLTGNALTATTATTANACTGNSATATLAADATALATPRAITMIGDVDWTVTFDGSAAESAAGTIQPNVVDNSKLAQAPALTMKGNDGNVTADVADLSVSAIQTLLGITGGSGGADYFKIGGWTVCWGYSAGAYVDSSTVTITLPVGLFTTSVNLVGGTVDCTGGSPNGLPYAVIATSAPSTTTLDLEVQGYQSAPGGHVAGIWWWCVGK